MDYHPLRVTCPECRVRCDTTNVFFRLDGMVMVEALCPQCEQEVQLELPYATTLEVCECGDDKEINLLTWKPQGRPS